VVKIASGLNVDLNTDNKEAKETKTSSLSYETSLLYSDALDKMDKGENGKAIELLKKVLQKNPDFAPAKKALDKLNANV
jgi:outer membrane protein assembly factor BamD (BamD/ComL family)